MSLNPIESIISPIAPVPQPPSEMELVSPQQSVHQGVEQRRGRVLQGKLIREAVCC